MEISIITDDCLMQNKVRHYVLNTCIENRYHPIDIKIEKSPFPIKFIHQPSNYRYLFLYELSDFCNFQVRKMLVLGIGFCLAIPFDSINLSMDKLHFIL